MANYLYDIIDGQRVEKNVAKDFRGMAAEFYKLTGCTLHVRSGTRTFEEQAAGRRDYLAGRTSVVWADPYESSHCEVGPAGPRALDLYDSGKDAGVTVYGSARWTVLKGIAAKHGFQWGGWGVPKSEGWHWENHRARVGEYGIPASPPPVNAVPSPNVMLAWAWKGIQKMLKRYYGYYGAIDGKPGPLTIGAFQRFIKAKGYRNLKIDGKWGPETAKGAQVWLSKRPSNPYRGAIDGIPGPATASSWATAENENFRAF